MSANWNSQFIFAIGVAVALGNVLALGVHVFTWWLRKRAKSRLTIAIIGGLSSVFFLWCAWQITQFVDSGGFGFAVERPPLPTDWKLQAVFAFAKIAVISFVVIGLVGSLQKRQIPASWLVASLCFCFEVTLATPLTLMGMSIFPWQTYAALGYNYSQISSFTKVFAGVFMCSLFVLAFFRPFFLTVLKYVRRYIRPNSLDVEQNL